MIAEFYDLFELGSALYVGIVLIPRWITNWLYFSPTALRLRVFVATRVMPGDLFESALDQRVYAIHPEGEGESDA